MTHDGVEDAPGDEPSLLDWLKSLFGGRPVALRSPGGSGASSSPTPASVEAGASIGAADRARPGISRLREWARANSARASALGLAWLLTLFVFYRLPGMSLDQSYMGVTLAWVAAGGLYLYVVAGLRTRPARSIRLELLGKPWIAAALLGIVLMALVVRVVAIAEVPHNVGGDEGSQGLEAVSVIEGRIRSPFTTGWLAVPTMSFYFHSLGIRILGRTVEGLRLPWALMGTLAVAAVYGLVAQIRGPRLGLLVAGLVATYHFHIHFSRLGSVQVADSFFTPLSLFLLHRAVDSRKGSYWALTGAANGLALFFYTGARLGPILTALIVAYLLIRRRRIDAREIAQGALVALGAFLIVASPMIQYALRFPDEFNARINQVGILQSGWLVREVEILDKSALSILWDQFVRATLAFTFFPDRTVWYGLREPLLGPLFGPLFLIGLGYGTVRVLLPNAERGLFTMVVWWWSGILLGGVLTESPPSSMRLVGLAIPVMFFVGYGLWRLVLLARRALAPIPVNVILTLALGVFAFTSLKLYFVDFSPQRIYGSEQAEIAVEVAPLLNDLSPEHQVFFFGAPRMYLGFATIPYLVPRLDGVDVEEALSAPPAADLIPPGRGGAFVFLPERLAELSLVQRTFPEGRTIELFSLNGDRLLASVYVVNP